MILVDSSVWIDHLRANEPLLAWLLGEQRVLGHAFALGERAPGTLSRRALTLRLLGDLPQAMVASQAEVMHLMEHEGLGDLGIGYVDAHLLASSRLSAARVWTRDKRLLAAAERLSVAAQLTS